MISYKDYEKKVYDWLLSKHLQDPNFTFSLRQLGSKGAETDYFIGKEKSKYFSTTFWNLPVSFPGSSGDCLGLIFYYTKTGYNYFFEFTQTKAPHDIQNEAALALVKQLQVSLDSSIGFGKQPTEKTKMFTLRTKTAKSNYETVEEMFSDIEKDFIILFPIVDKAIAAVKKEYPEFKANRLTIQDFESFTKKFSDRVKRYENHAINIDTIPEIAKDPDNEVSSDNYPLNQILYGPPGTGKTYNTINKALKIIGEKEEKDLDWNDRKAVKDQFDKRASEGRIVFTTFHQSMSYEDFIEGIKPVLENEAADNESVETDELKYEIKDGIFKNIANLARGVAGKIEKSTEIDFDNKNFYKMSLGGKHRQDKHNWSIKNNLIFLGWGEDKDFTALTKIKDWKTFRDTFKEKYPELVKESKYVIQAVFTFQAMKNGDIVFVTKGNNIIDAIGIITGDYFYDDTKEIDNYQFRKVKWLATDLNASPDIFVNKKISQQTIYQFYNDDIKTDVLDDYFNTPSDKNTSDKKYVLIIDEINRGNVSQIFGELITLIEPDKRINREEALEIMLPYSKLKFGVPDNLYIIGTMNTADRSVEALDTALRRRFCFEEMMPQTELLSPSAMYCNLLWEYENVDWEDTKFQEKETDLFNLLGVSEELKTQRKDIWDTKMFGKSRSDLSHFSQFKYTGIDLELLLNSINSRIEILLDRDDTIGHSYFLKIANENDLRSTFKNNILPLLQEYFYGDYEKIGLVLGEGFFQKNEEKNKVIFPKFYNAQKPDYKTQYTSVQIDDDFDIVAAIEKLIDKKVVKQTLENE